MTLEEAIRSFTIAGARASFTDDLVGSIEPGKLADFVVLEDDLFSMDPGAIHRARVSMTVVGGKVAFQR
jgi:predicted amidohydrolase YtcJ